VLWLVKRRGPGDVVKKDVGSAAEGVDGYDSECGGRWDMAHSAVHFWYEFAPAYHGEWQNKDGINNGVAKGSHEWIPRWGKDQI
jgi:hypothetical protein